MFEHILLEQEQQDLLVAAAEAARAVSQDMRQPFFFIQTFGGSDLHHPGLPGGSVPAYEGDIQALARAGLIAFLPGSRGLERFDVTPLGFNYYQHLKKQIIEPIERMENVLTGYINANRFQQTYTIAYQKWCDAEQLLWVADSNQQLTTIGHLCREAMQEFAATLVGKYRLQEAYPDKSKIVARIRAVAETLGVKTGDTLKSLLDGLITYWGTTVDLVQRQEHGSQRDGGELVWSDGRRVVLYTALVMFEIDSVVQYAG